MIADKSRSSEASEGPSLSRETNDTKLASSGSLVRLLERKPRKLQLAETDSPSLRLMRAKLDSMQKSRTQSPAVSPRPKHSDRVAYSSRLSGSSPSSPSHAKAKFIDHGTRLESIKLFSGPTNNAAAQETGSFTRDASQALSDCGASSPGVAYARLRGASVFSPRMNSLSLSPVRERSEVSEEDDCGESRVDAVVLA
uniref:Uncharacterized protein n=1 Tax=Erythrolobus australicus TaxID=1077150 RepID=A0A7S1TMB0_9RHOD|mmetsp:Transcript_4922/g.13246  ORF Transcript_4922/g.13246 Transcript_4922/m.13246 type:complete len:197 (-) Transcript_4922:81-671(-)|eukprot:CAMPEP_0185833478 /NCGR_PEP_ID=MMETSP1353-20130828/2975_1 /TAXON_ID=1077150 /ORGANISM="Erythrolobus australicus, Strain CCMP3124" /LENGTH=196 /DNA_ID=CAMNT_0028531775 /DNA_START=69 /DNA_END=659 /DNA_ORIENTATION=+